MACPDPRISRMASELVFSGDRRRAGRCLGDGRIARTAASPSPQSVPDAKVRTGFLAFFSGADHWNAPKHPNKRTIGTFNRSLPIVLFRRSESLGPTQGSSPFPPSSYEQPHSNSPQPQQFVRPSETLAPRKILRLTPPSPFSLRPVSHGPCHVICRRYALRSIASRRPKSPARCASAGSYLPIWPTPLHTSSTRKSPTE